MIIIDNVYAVNPTMLNSYEVTSKSAFITSTSVYLIKVVFTVGSLKVYQNYLIDFINPCPGHDIPQTFVAHTSDVTNVHDDIDKIKQFFPVLNCYII